MPPKHMVAISTKPLGVCSCTTYVRKASPLGAVLCNLVECFDSTGIRLALIGHCHLQAWGKDRPAVASLRDSWSWTYPEGDNLILFCCK